MSACACRYCFAVRDQNRLVYQADEDFVASLPAELRGPACSAGSTGFKLTLDDSWPCSRLALTASQQEPREDPVAPANLHWCSDAALTRLGECRRRYNVPLHMHLVETAYRRNTRAAAAAGTAVEYIDRFGLLGPKMTLGHGVWLNEADIDRLAETGPASATTAPPISGCAPASRR